MRHSLFQKGFTMVELLVVIAIIGILSAVVYGSFGEAREEARNKAIRAELKEVQLALELYKAQYGRYPAVPTPAECGHVQGSERYALSAPGECTVIPYITGHQIGVNFVPDFIAELPVYTDSGNPNCEIEYRIENFGTWYKLVAINCHVGAADAAEGVQPDDEMARCPTTCSSGDCGSGSYDATDASFYESYAVYSTGGKCE